MKPSDDAPRSFKVAAVLLSVLAVLLIAEGGLRLRYALRNRHNPPPIELSPERGWRSRPEVHSSYRLRAYGDVTYSTDERGFRSFGDTDAEALRIFALGDSFTQAKQVSDGEPYYDQLAALFPSQVEIFAYGAGGYGTLQQLMVLEAFFEEIRPNLVLWQFSFNDLVNNDYQLESASSERNNHMRRPYLEGGEVVYRHPDAAWAPWTVRSVLARRLRIAVDSVRQRTSGTPEQSIDLDHADFRRAVETTRKIYRRGVELVAPAPVVAFQASPLDRFGFEDEGFARVCAGVVGLHCIDDMLSVMRAARDAGAVIDGEPGDGHWNREGHRLAAQRIYSYLGERELLVRLPASGNGEDT